MDFKVDDLVWAKMKGFPSWPARIVEPNSSIKAPKYITGYEFLKFFGTADVAWIPKNDITPHSESIIQDLKNRKKSKKFQQSIDELLLFLGKPVESKKKSFSKIKEAVRDKKTRVDKIIKTAANKYQIVKKEKACIKRVPQKKNDIKGNQSADSEVSEEPGPHRDTYGFIGLNNLGRAILRKFVKYGIKVILWDDDVDLCARIVTGTKEIQQADSPAELIAKCDITFCCYEIDNEEYVPIVKGDNGILKGFEDAEKLGRNPGYVGLAYVDFKTSELIHKTAIVKNAMYLEAPVHGSDENVETADMIINASGDKTLYMKCKKCFDLIAKDCFFLGCEIGMSSKTNIILNAITGTINAATAEAMVLAGRSSIDLHERGLSEVCHLTIENNNNFERVMRMDNRNTEPIIPLKHVQSNIHLALMEADKLNQRMPMTAAANELYKHARLLNYADADVSAIYKVIKY